MNIFKLFKNDHKEVKDLLEQILKKDEVDWNLAQQVCRKLTIHMELEEKLFYPVLKKHNEVREMIEEAYLEHDEAKKLVRAIERSNLEQSELKVECEMLNLAILHHVDEEEGHVFPKAQAVLSSEQIDALSKEFSKQQQARLAKL